MVGGCRRVTSRLQHHVTSKRCTRNRVLPSRVTLTRRFNIDQVALGGTVSVVTVRNLVFHGQNIKAFIVGDTL